MKVMKKVAILFLAAAVAVSPISPVVAPASTVMAAKKPALSKKSAKIDIGATITLKVKNNKAKVAWKTSNKKVATVSKKGEVKGISAGSATITAAIGKTKLNCKVTVVENPKISKTSITIENGDTETLKVTGTKQKVTWTSDNESIATVSSSGEVEAVGEGTCNISATVGSKTLTCKVKVNPVSEDDEDYDDDYDDSEDDDEEEEEEEDDEEDDDFGDVDDGDLDEDDE